MSQPKPFWKAQLKELCKLAPINWAIWVFPTETGWEYILDQGLGKRKTLALEEFLGQSKTIAWLAGAFGSGRTRSCKTGIFSDRLACQRVYAFPNIEARSALLVGTDHLEKFYEGLLKVIVLNPPSLDRQGEFLKATHKISNDPVRNLRPIEAALEVSFDPQGVLENVLELISSSIACDAAVMTIRSGDLFRVEAIRNCPVSARGMDLSLDDSAVLSQMINTQKGWILIGKNLTTPDAAIWVFGEELSKSIKSLMVIPIIIGKRVIGHLGFISQRQGVFKQKDLHIITSQISRLAYVVEYAIVFTEAARYLQQLALLNDLASAASMSVDTNEVAHRVMQRLHRTFNTKQAGVFLLSADSKMLRDYGAERFTRPAKILPVQTGRLGQVVSSGLPIRIGDYRDPENSDEYFEEKSPINSLMAVPLKYRGKIIGVLALGSEKSNAFILQDEQLLVVIASHLAGLFENVRLNEETRQRAHNLNLIHQVVRRILGINDLNEIATLTAELMVKEFSYELASVILYFGNGKIITTRGEAGAFTLRASTRSGDQTDIGVSRLVFSDGKSRLLNDVETENAYIPANQWIGGSEMCVPLREGERLLGVIDVQRSRKHAFTENDLLALEALAGVVSSVVLSALRYGQLQDSVKQLQAVRETALDIAADLELNTHLLRVVQRARDLVGAKGAELGLLDEEAQVLRVLVSDTPWYEHNTTEIPLWAGVAGKVAALGEPLVIDDYNTWNGRLYPERIAPFRSVAGVPLKFQGQVIGTLTIIDDRPDWTFDSTHMQLLELLAPQVTVWIRNAKLYQELQERIEAQRSAENRLIRSARLAAVGEMAAGVAHELNNPLTTVAGFVELVLDELPQDSPHRPDLELVLRESHRARGVVRRLLDFSRPGENRRIRTDLNELVSDVLTLVHHLVRTGGVEMKIDLSLDLPWVSVDPAQIKQVFLNLVHNSIQSMPSGGTLLVKTARGITGESPDIQAWATVAIIDDGEGISKENLERIFEPFFTTRPAGKGTGLGLSVSYGIISDHDGFIEVDSQIGQGSCFTVFLPLEKDNLHDR